MFTGAWYARLHNGEGDANVWRGGFSRLLVAVGRKAPYVGCGLIFWGLLCLVIGVVMLLAGDLMWSWQRFNNDLEGQASKRTEAWEVRRFISGIIFIVLGAVTLFVAFFIK
jgi:hypothetical protein